MVLCFLLIHLLELQQLPPRMQETYILSNTNSCKVYSMNTWDVVRIEGNLVTVSNGVIESKGYKFKTKGVNFGK